MNAEAWSRAGDHALKEEADHRASRWAFLLALAVWVVVPVVVWVPVVAYLVFGWTP